MTTQTEALKLAEQEPVAWRTALERIADPRNTHFGNDARVVAKSALDTTPPQRKPLTDEMVYAAARAMSDTHAESCGVDKDDHWKLYGDVYNDDARIMLKAAHGIKE